MTVSDHFPHHQPHQQYQTSHPSDTSKKVQECFYKGLAWGSVSAMGLTGASALANRYSRFYRGFSLPGKIFFVASGALAVTMSVAEHTMVREYYKVRGSISSQASKIVPATWKDYALVHKAYWITALAVTSAGVGYFFNMRNKHLEPSIRFMNIRLLSQGVTLTALLTGIVLAPIKPKFKEVAPK